MQPIAQRRVLSLFLVLVIVLSVAPLAAAAPAFAPQAPLANDLRISQVYGAGGSTGAPYTHDFIEIFNAGAAPVSLNGMSIQYASATGTGNFGATATQITVLPNVALNPGRYYLVQAAGGAVGDPLPTPDLIDPQPISLAAASGKVIIANTATTLGCNGGSSACSPAQLAQIIDLVGYGTANFFEGSGGAPQLTNSTAAIRAGNGCTDTDDNAADFTAAAPNPRNSSSPANVCGVVDNPPSVTSTTPANGAPNVAVNSTITVAFSESVDVTADAFTVECPVDTPVAFSSTPELPANGISSVVLTPDSNLPNATTCTVTVVAAEVTDRDGTPQNMVADHIFTFTTVAPPTIAKIHEIQGSGNTSNPGTFIVEAIVTGDYQGATGVDDFKLDGFFIQEEDADADGDPATSEGIFVFCGSCPTNVVVGDKVQVTGASSEYFGMSQLTAATAGAVVVVSSDNPLPSPAALTLPVPGVIGPDLISAQAQINAYYEPFEGMLVTVNQPLSVTEYFELSRYGQVVLAQGGRFRQFTDSSAPLTAGYIAHLIDKARRTVILDDDSNQQNHALFENVPVFHPTPGFSISNYVRGGDTITDLTGVLHWSFAGLSGTDAWRIRPVPSAFSYAFAPGNPRTAAPAAMGGSVRVASFNVLNYFTTLNVRGAHSTAELNRQADKIVAALAGLDADVIGVMEIENNGTAIADLVSRLNAVAGADTYGYVNTGVVGTDQITVGIIYKTARVTPVGSAQTLTEAAFTDPNNTGTQRSRPAVAQTFEENTWGERFTVVVNHLKSKRCSASPAPDTDQLDGQGCWNDTRQKAAAYLVNTWIPALAASSGDPDFLIIGDLNAYRNEDPISNIQSAGYTDLLDDLLGAPAYGYVFDGQLGYLDHALSSATLTPQVTGVTEWHINSDEVNLLDYNDTIVDPGEANFDAKPAALPLYEANAYRSSDHDPVLVGLELKANDWSDLPTTYGRAWHTGDGAWRMGELWASGAASGPGLGDNDGVARNYAESWNDGRGEVMVTVTGPQDEWACLNAWLDYSAGAPQPYVVDAPDGQFNPNEHVVLNYPMQPGADQLVTWPLEIGVIDPSATYNMRFRLVADPNNDGDCSDVSLAAGLDERAPASAASPTGGAIGGEVEDHSFTAGPLAVTLASFDASGQDDRIVVAWQTVSEIGNAGFNLYRSDSASGPLTLLAAVDSQAPGSTQGFAYSYDDLNVQPGETWWYWLEDVSLGGATTLHGPVSATVQGPTAVTLSSLSASPAAAAAPLTGALLALLVPLAGAAWAWRRRS